MSNRRRLIVSYQSTPDLSVWQRIQPDFIAQLPLRNLHWKTASRSLRTIQSLDIDLRAFQSLPADQAQQIPPSLLERPYLHLLFVACNDNEVYRATIRQHIRDWLDAVSTRRNQEWLIVHVATSKAGPAKFYQRKGTVADKIKADFNIGKRDRVPQLTLGPAGSAEDPVLWAELISKIKDSIITTFDANVSAFEEDVRKVDSQRSLPGWNFCMFFVQKEGLALSFEAMNLLEDALIQYDELEASFFQSLRENTLVWFGKLGGTAPGDDSLDIFSASAKPYRDLIKNNAISLFDFRMYLFARQGSLLGRLGRTLEIARRGTAFIGNISYSLRQQQSLLDRDFVAAWTYSAATQIVNHCDRSLAASQGHGAGSAAHYAIRAELTELACKQLEKIGVAHGLLPADGFFGESVDEEAAPPTSSNIASSHPAAISAVTQPDIRRALQQPADFQQLLASLLSHAYEDYMASQRHRSAARLQARLASHHELQQRADLALQGLNDLPDFYASPHWTRLQAGLLARLARLQQEKGDHREQLISTLSLLRAGMADDTRWELELGGRETPEQVAMRLLADAVRLSQELEKDFAVIAFPTCQIRLASDVGHREADSEAVWVDVLVSNRLPCAMQADDIRLKLTAADGEHIWFASGSLELSPGTTHVRCLSTASVAGTCHLETSQVRLAKVVLQYSHHAPSREGLSDSKRASLAKVVRPTVHFSLDPFALRMRLVDTPRVVIDQQRSVVLRITAGRTPLAAASLAVAAKAGDVAFDLAAASAQAGSSVTVTPEKAAVRFGGLARGQTLDIQLPFDVHTNAPSVDVHFELLYAAEAGQTLARRVRASLQLSLALPLAVSVQDHFRSDRAISCFTISTAERSGLRVGRVDLSGTDAKSPRSPHAPPMVVLPGQPATAVFVHPLDSAPARSPTRPSLTVSYRCIEAKLVEHLRTALQASASPDLAPMLDDLAAALSCCVDSARQHALFGRLQLRAFDEQGWRRRLQSLYGNLPVVDSVLAALRRVHELEEIPADPAQLAWRTLQIPVERPSMPLVCQTSLQLTDGATRLVAGEPTRVIVHLEASDSWSVGPRGERPKFAYDVTASVGDWVIAGRKKGELVEKVGNAQAVEMTLVPLRVGRLTLPRVSVMPVADPSMASRLPAVETYQVNAAQQVDVLPSEARSAFVVDLS